uniref:Protein kinase domain-containing protein n=1 Tax=Aquila chrysaetos chrysaetos TaxID=223781 RepID=A0A663DPM4_AQUCH
MTKKKKVISRCLSCSFKCSFCLSSCQWKKMSCYNLLVMHCCDIYLKIFTLSYLGQLIAVKQVVLAMSDQLTTEKEYQKFHEEVDLLKTLKHVSIVTYLGTCLEDNTLSIFIEFVPGGSISSIINRFGPLPEIVLCQYTKQILQGVAYLHDNCVVHRDIKGNNVMLMPNGIVKLTDFGSARRLAWVSLHGTQSEMLNSVHATPYWMAPEVINESGYGRKSDTWSVDCTLFEMATGKLPLASMDRIATKCLINFFDVPCCSNITLAESGLCQASLEKSIITASPGNTYLFET